MNQERFMLDRDKANHVVYGAIAYALGGWYLCAAVAIGKEVYDKFVRKTEFSIKDVVATIGGGIIVFLGGINVL